MEVNEVLPEDRKRVSIRNYMRVRQRCRTDLIYLCQKVLGYVDVDAEVHGPICEGLQQFKGGSDRYTSEGMFIDYEPFVSLWHLEGKRKTLILFPRGHLKSTIATIAHTIQWIINYPDVRIIISTATGDQAKKFLTEIKGHFQFNEAFRYFFPEFCPDVKKVADFGSQEQFTVPCRRKKRKEPTVFTCTVGSVVSSVHVEVVKNDDLVDKENVRTKDQILNVNQHFSMLWPLVETSHIKPENRPKYGDLGWMDVTGTRYDFSDLYGVIIKGEKEAKEKLWNIVVRSAIYDDDKGTPRALWPNRLPLEVLEAMRNDPTIGSATFNSQYLQNPIADGQGLAKADEIVWVPRDEINKLKARLRESVTVDLGGLDGNKKGSDNDYTVINHHGFGGDGRLYVLNLIRGRFSPQEVIEHIFQLLKANPRITNVKVEKEAHARVLLPFLRGEMARRRMYVPILEIRRDNQTSKENRIKGLQPWFEGGLIRFAADIPCRSAIEDEIQYFPKYAHDDILDTCADAMQNADGVSWDMVPSVTEVERTNPTSPLATNAYPEIFGVQEETHTVDSITGW